MAYPHKIPRSLVSCFFIVAFVFSSLAQAAVWEWEHWEDLANELALMRDDVVFYDQGIAVSEIRGFVITNEIGHASFPMPEDTFPAETMVGFGSTVNWSIAVWRRPERLLLFDGSIDVIAAHKGFFKPLFHISNSAEEFLARGAGLHWTPGMTIDEIFGLATRGHFDLSGYDDTRDKLKMITDQGLISSAEAEFCLAAILAQHPDHPSNTELRQLLGLRQYPFRTAATGRNPIVNLIGVHYPPVMETLLAQGNFPPLDKEARARLQRMDIFSPANFAYLKNIYTDKRVFFGIANFFDPSFWYFLVDYSRNFGTPITDIYTSNISTLAANELKNLPTAMDQIFNIIGNRMHHYYSTGNTTGRFKFTRDIVGGSPISQCEVLPVIQHYLNLATSGFKG